MIRYRVKVPVYRGSKILLSLSFLLIVVAGWAVTGNIAPNAIEIDGSPAANATTTQKNQANLYPTGANSDTGNFPGGLGGFVNGPILNAPAAWDWVKDSLPNTDDKTYIQAVVTGIDPTGANTGGVPTGAVNGKGHWNGVRIVDVGISGDPTHDDIFTKGGKENLVNEWPSKIAPGSIGSDKYNFTQGYLANNNEYLFAAFERAGTNGTTAYDLEFNKEAPDPTKQPGYDPATNPDPIPYVPNRTDGDVLFTFEAHGSGGADSGTVTPHYFLYDETTSAFVEQPIPAHVFTSTNDNTTTKCEPWGHVNFTNAGTWDYTNLKRFELAEIAVDISETFGNFTPCLATYWTSIRTRASATDTSDLKDAGPMFKYSFGGPQAVGAITPDCTYKFNYDAEGSKDSNGTEDDGTGMTYSWLFQKATGDPDDPNTPANEAWEDVGTASGFTGTFDASASGGGTYRAILTVTEAATCVNSNPTNSAVAIAPVDFSPTLDAKCDLVVDYASGTVTGGVGAYSYEWKFYSGADASPFATRTNASGSVTAPDTDAVTATLKVTAAGGCTNTKNAGPVTPIASIVANPVLTPICDLEVQFSAGAVSGGTAPYSYAWTFYSNGVQFATSNLSSGSVIAPDNDPVTATLVVTDSSDPQCSGTFNPTQVIPNMPIVVSIVKTSANGTNLSVLLTGTVTLNGNNVANPTRQWQRYDPVAAAWVNIAGATGPTLTYSTFEADDTDGASATSFSIGSDSYVGKIYSVGIRLTASTTVNSDTCPGTSNTVTVKKVIAVDP